MDNLMDLSEFCQDGRGRDTARKAMKRIVLKDTADYQGIDAGSTY